MGVPNYGAVADLPGRLTQRKHYASLAGARANIFDHASISAGLASYPHYYPWEIYSRVQQPSNWVGDWNISRWNMAYPAEVHFDGPIYFRAPEGELHVWKKLATPLTVSAKAGDRAEFRHDPNSRVYVVEPRSPLSQDGLTRRPYPDWVVDPQTPLPVFEGAYSASNASTGSADYSEPQMTERPSTRAPPPRPRTSNPPDETVASKKFQAGGARRLVWWDKKYPNPDIVTLRGRGGSRYRVR